MGDFTITRRAFLMGVGAGVAGLALGVRRARAETSNIFVPGPFLQIANDGTVTIFCARSEMGQGIRSSLPLLIADELGADPAEIRIMQADGDARFGDQDTDGSGSIRGLFDEMRTVGATARVMLVSCAARQWKVAPSTCIAKDDAVHDGRGNHFRFAELAMPASSIPVPKKVALRPLRELAHVGKESLPLVDGHDFVTGKASYGADVRLPGMLTAVIARPPALGGKATKFDGGAAKAITGVRHVFELKSPSPPYGYQPLGGVAVIADHTWAALKGRAALGVTWQGGEIDHDSDRERAALLAVVRAPGEIARKKGDATHALSVAARTIEAEYLVPYLIHAAMEPPAAVARIDSQTGDCEIWAPTQSPQDAQSEVATALGIDKSKVTVHVTFLGGGFGRKSKPDFIVEAALCARAAGVPVRVQWTREDELRHGYYHAVSAQSLAAGLDASGHVTAWRQRVAYPTISSTFANGKERASDFELAQGVMDLPLAVPHVLVETGKATPHLRIGWLRSVANIQQAFAVQSFIDELATATRRDPRDMLLEILGPARTLSAAGQGVKKLDNYGAPLDRHPIDVARLQRVIARVTESAGWDAAKKSGRALGLAVHRSFLSYVAVVASVVKKPDGALAVDEAWIVADAGLVVNPDRVRAQLEGAFVFGMSLALHGAITIKSGAVEQRGFRDYPITRIGEVPRAIHVELLASDRPPGGVGEPGVPPVAPAIMNAIFSLTAKRVRELPLVRALR